MMFVEGESEVGEEEWVEDRVEGKVNEGQGLEGRRDVRFVWFRATGPERGGGDPEEFIRDIGVLMEMGKDFKQELVRKV